MVTTLIVDSSTCYQTIRCHTILEGARSVILKTPDQVGGDVIPDSDRESLEDRVLCVDTLNEAVAAIGFLATPGSAILYENDLPDTFV